MGIRKAVNKKVNGVPTPKAKGGQMYKRVAGQYVPYTPTGIEKDSIKAILNSKKTK